LVEGEMTSVVVLAINIRIRIAGAGEPAGSIIAEVCPIGCITPSHSRLTVPIIVGETLDLAAHRGAALQVSCVIVYPLLIRIARVSHTDLPVRGVVSERGGIINVSRSGPARVSYLPDRPGRIIDEPSGKIH